MGVYEGKISKIEAEIANINTDKTPNTSNTKTYG